MSGMKRNLSPEQRAALRDELLRRRQNPEFMAKRNEAFAEACAWAPERLAELRALLDQGLTATAAGHRMGVDYKVITRQMAKQGWVAVPYKAAECCAAEEVLRLRWATPMLSKDILAEYRVAIGRNVVKSTMTQHAHKIGLGERPAEAKALALQASQQNAVVVLLAKRAEVVDEHLRAGANPREVHKVAGIPIKALYQLVRRGLLKHWPAEYNSRAETNAKRLAESRTRRAAEVQKAIDAGATVKEACAASGVSRELWATMKRTGLVIAPERVKAAPKPRSAPVRPRPKVYAPSKPVPRRPAEVNTSDAMAAFLARGGQIKRLPVAAAAYTTATIPQEAREALAAYRQKIGGYGNALTWVEIRKLEHKARKAA